MGYQEIKDTLYRGHRKIANNTKLELCEGTHEECIDMRLHGNVVARFYPDYLELFSGGWYTPTTKNRLNLALDVAGVCGYSVWQHNYHWYYGYLLSGEWFENGMRLDYQGNRLN